MVRSFSFSAQTVFLMVKLVVCTSYFCASAHRWVSGGERLKTTLVLCIFIIIVYIQILVICISVPNIYLAIFVWYTFITMRVLCSQVWRRTVAIRQMVAYFLGDIIIVANIFSKLLSIVLISIHILIFIMTAIVTEIFINIFYFMDVVVRILSRATQTLDIFLLFSSLKVIKRNFKISLLMLFSRSVAYLSMFSTQIFPIDLLAHTWIVLRIFYSLILTYRVRIVILNVCCTRLLRLLDLSINYSWSYQLLWYFLHFIANLFF